MISLITLVLARKYTNKKIVEAALDGVSIQDVIDQILPKIPPGPQGPQGPPGESGMAPQEVKDILTRLEMVEDWIGDIEFRPNKYKGGRAWPVKEKKPS